MFHYSKYNSDVDFELIVPIQMPVTTAYYNSWIMLCISSQIIQYNVEKYIMIKKWFLVTCTMYMTSQS